MISLDEGKYAKYLEGPKTKKGKAKEFNKIKVAKKAYQAEIKTFRTNMSQIFKLAEKHIGKQAKDPTEWKYVGDVSLWNDKLDDIIERMRMGIK